MELLLCRHLWGVDLTHGIEPYLDRWVSVGYGAIEAPTFALPDAGRFHAMRRERGLRWVPQVIVRGRTVAEQLADLRGLVEAELPQEPLFCAAHSASDSWSATQAEDFYGAALEIERALGVTVAHETHRGRYFFNPWSTRPILEQFPALRLTCDFSHWVCVAERLLDDCDDIIALAARHCHHLHARVGHGEGPQVSDPRAPEFAGELAAHEGWWSMIWAAQRAAGQAVSTLTPEFGPPPYLATLPFTRVPVTDLAEVCDWMARRQAERFAGEGNRLPSPRD